LKTFGDRSAVERFFSQLKDRVKRFWNRFPHFSILSSVQSWLNSFIALHNYWRASYHSNSLEVAIGVLLPESYSIKDKFYIIINFYTILTNNLKATLIEITGGLVIF